VPADPRPRIIDGEAEWLGLAGINNLAKVEPHAVGQNLHLVDQVDVDGEVDVSSSLTISEAFVELTGTLVSMKEP
jgi:hypothetical protein